MKALVADDNTTKTFFVLPASEAFRQFHESPNPSLVAEMIRGNSTNSTLEDVVGKVLRLKRTLKRTSQINKAFECSFCNIPLSVILITNVLGVFTPQQLRDDWGMNNYADSIEETPKKAEIECVATRPPKPPNPPNESSIIASYPKIVDNVVLNIESAVYMGPVGTGRDYIILNARCEFASDEMFYVLPGRDVWPYLTNVDALPFCWQKTEAELKQLFRRQETEMALLKGKTLKCLVTIIDHYPVSFAFKEPGRTYQVITQISSVS